MPKLFNTPKRLVLRMVPRVLPKFAKRSRHTAAVATIPRPPELSIVTSTASSQYASSPPTVSTNAVVKSRRSSSRGIAKDVVLLGLEGLASSADAFPPLKSVVGGLLFLTNQVELVSSNKEQIDSIYAQIDTFAESLVRAIPDATTLSPAREAAILSLAADVTAVSLDIEHMARQRPIVRFLRAKSRAAHLGQLMKRLDKANDTFTRTILSSVEIKATEILDTVLPLREEVHRLVRIGRYFFFQPTGWHTRFFDARTFALPENT